MLGSVGSSYDESYTRVPDSDSSITSVEPFSPVVSSSVVVPEGIVLPIIHTYCTIGL